MDAVLRPVIGVWKAPKNFPAPCFFWALLDVARLMVISSKLSRGLAAAFLMAFA